MARSQRRRGPDRIDPAANQDRTRDRRRRASHGLLAERLPGCQEIASLYAVGVGERRERLVERWDRIHEWLGATLTVIGSAVMDQVYVTGHLPESGASAELETYETHPGGKGLVRAVTNARMGMNVQLMTAIGDDTPGRELTGYLDREGLSTELVKITPNAMSPVVAVLMPPSGRGRYLSWMNRKRVRLVPTDFHTARLRSSLESSDAVALTFEQPLDTTGATLRAVRGSENKPLAVVRPSPPVKNPRALYDHFKGIDFLIGTRRELRKPTTAEHRRTGVRLAPP